MPGGTQPGLRYYDEADRDRRRDVATLSPSRRSETFDVSVTYSGGRDEFLTDEFTEPTRGRFGLLDADTQAVTFGGQLRAASRGGRSAPPTATRPTAPSSNSRNATPPPSAEWFDPTRDWTLDNDEKVNTFTLYVDLLKAITNTDIRFSYDFMDSNNDFVHGGPRIQQLNTNTSVTGHGVLHWRHGLLHSAPGRRPRRGADWPRIREVLLHAQRRGSAFAYWYENQDVRDFATIDANGSVGFTTPTGTPRVDYLGGLITGYGARDYRGSTASIRLLYIF